MPNFGPAALRCKPDPPRLSKDRGDEVENEPRGVSKSRQYRNVWYRRVFHERLSS